MARFCTQCGKEAKAEHKVCVYCGTPLKDHDITTKSTNVEQSEEHHNDAEETKEKSSKDDQSKVSEMNEQTGNNKPPQRSSKKKNVLYVGVGAIALICIIFFMWAKSYQSSDNVLNRFEKALDNKNAANVAKLMTHEDKSSVSKAEAEAFIELVHETDETITYRPIRDGKFLFLFDAYKIMTEDQYAYYNHYTDGLTFLFNDTEFDIYNQSDAAVTYGPLLPGIYVVEATYEGDFGESTVEEELVLYDAYDSNPYIDVDLRLSNVVLTIENYDLFDTKKAFIAVGDEKVSIDENGESESFGPIILDGEQEASVVIEMPWGEVTSDPISLTEDYMTVHANLISEDHFEEVAALTTSFAEQFLQSLAEQSTKPLEDGSSKLKKDVTYYIDDYLHYTGQVEEVEIDKVSIFYDKDEKNSTIYVPTLIHTYEDYHYIEESPALDHDEWFFDIGFTFKDDKWVVDSLQSLSSWSFEGTDTFDGEKKLYGPSKEAIESATSREFEERMTDFIFDYTEASVDAINYRDFSLVEDYITKDGPRKKEAADYIEYLDSKDIYEEWYGSTVEKIEETGDETWKVTTVEEFEIIRPDDWEVKRFRTVVVVKEIDKDLYVDELISTKEIE